MPMRVGIVFAAFAVSSAALLADSTTRPSTAPATRPATAASSLTEQLQRLVSQDYAGLRSVGLALKDHRLEGGRMWETKSNFVIRDRSKGIGAALAGRTGTVAIFDYLAKPADGTERPWVPRSQGMVLFPYSQSKLEVSEEKVGGRPARLLSADDWRARRLIVRANDRFDVVFALRPGSDEPDVPLDDLRSAAEQFDWATLDALRDVPPAYEGPQVSPPQR